MARHVVHPSTRLLLVAKLKILTKALEDTPEREDARIPLYRAAVSAPEDEFALASIEQMLREQRIRQVAPNVTNGEDEIISDDRSDAEQNAMTSIYAGAKLPPTQQAQIAQAVGLTLARLNRLGEALAYMYMQVARNLEKTQPRRKEIAAELAEIRAQLRRQQGMRPGSPFCMQIWSRIAACGRASSPAQHPR